MESGQPCTAMLMCHAPIVIPAIGRSESSRCAATTQAMTQAAEILVAAQPETIVVISPHTPRHPTAFGFISGERLRGDFGTFGITAVDVSLPNDMAAASAIRRTAFRKDIEVERVQGTGLDHGASVPLWFLQKAGCRSRIVVLGLPWQASTYQQEQLGQAICQAMAGLGRRWSLLASGDMSHALQPGAPGGFHPQAKLFDEKIIACLKQGRLSDVASIPEELRTHAAEDVSASLVVATGVLAGAPCTHQVLSYEAPFGVGYLIAILKEGSVE